MDIQVEEALREFKTKYNKPADVVGLEVEMNQNAKEKQVQWKVLIQESKSGIHYRWFRSRGSAKSPSNSLKSTLDQINSKTSNLKNFKKVGFFKKDIGSLLITQVFAIYS